MKLFSNKRKRGLLIWLSVLLAVAGTVTAVFCIYVNDYYRADTDAIAAFAPAENVDIRVIGDGTIAYVPENAVAGLIFYPGGKVEYTAYEPLMLACAEKGILCVLTEMPFNLAVFDINAADGIPDRYPDIKSWYIGGHSLGGSMAASYLAENASRYDGLILLGSYSTADLSDTELKVLSVYGSEDKVLNREKYDSNKENLPSSLVETVIDGGNHSFFGVYGAQKGDGTPWVTNAQQIKITADEIEKLVFGDGE